VDFERLDALDLPLLDDQIVQLCAGGRVELPHYNFRKGRRETGPNVQLADEQVLVVEGIHGLNPELVRSLPADRVFRIFVAPLTPINLERYNRVSTRDTRLVRRIVRDAATRGYDAVETIGRWSSVVAGEKRHIFPFQENSDAMFNSSLGHELAVLRPLAEPLLLRVRPEASEWLEANRLLALLQWFRPVSREVVPTNSILREFIGGSVLDTFNFTPLEVNTESKPV
jgi:uridine kinase